MSDTPAKTAENSDQRSKADKLLDDIRTALQSFYDHNTFERSNHRTPLDELISSEEPEGDEWEIKNETVKALFGFLGAEGPDPLTVLKRVYAVGLHMGIAPFCQLTVRERGLMLGESHGAQHWRLHRLCVDPLRRQGAKAINAPGAKGRDASASCANAQSGNTNRKNGRRVAVRKALKKKKS